MWKWIQKQTIKMSISSYFTGRIKKMVGTGNSKQILKANLLGQICIGALNQ